jgi:hypothetical protein
MNKALNDAVRPSESQVETFIRVGDIDMEMPSCKISFFVAGF